MQTLNAIASKYIGIREKPNNSGFTDANFEKRMRTDGEWQHGWAWCMCFVQLCVSEWLGDKFAKWDAAFTPSVMRTFNLLMRAGLFVHKTPLPGDIAIWVSFKNGKETPFGHTGIVDSVSEGKFKCIEGNTNGAGAREGDRVAVKDRTLNFAPPKHGNGLRLLGFMRLPHAEL